MLRWLILLSTLAVWLVCMVLIYDRFHPRDRSGTTAGAAQALNQLFDENAELDRAWRIYIDVDRINEQLESKSPKASRRINSDGSFIQVWDGIDEAHLREVGWLYTSLNKKFTRIEQLTEMSVSPPSDLKSDLFRALQMSFTSRAEISQDQGVERFVATFKPSAAIDLEVKSFGVRDDTTGGMTITKQIWQNNKQLHASSDRLPAAGRIWLDGLDLLPFQTNAEIKEGARWEIDWLDFSANVNVESERPRMQAVCIGKRQIQFEGRQVWALESRTEDGNAWAWYSADGKVYKQVITINNYDVMIVRVETSKEGNPFGVRKLRGTKSRKKDRSGNPADAEETQAH
jgi:hypothetical protein